MTNMIGMLIYYQFSMWWNSICMWYVNKIHLLIYEQSDIICKIGGNDITLKDYTFDVKMYKMQLNWILSWKYNMY